jgi:hypothetical protein
LHIKFLKNIYLAPQSFDPAQACPERPVVSEVEPSRGDGFIAGFPPTMKPGPLLPMSSAGI